MPLDPSLVEFLRSQPGFLPDPGPAGEFIPASGFKASRLDTALRNAPVPAAEVARLYAAGQEQALPAHVLAKAEALLAREREQRARGPASEAAQRERQAQLRASLGNAPPPGLPAAAPAPVPGAAPGSVAPPSTPSPMPPGPLGEMLGSVGFGPDHPALQMGMGAKPTPLDFRPSQEPEFRPAAYDPALDPNLQGPEPFEIAAENEALQAKHDERLNRQRELLGIVRGGELLGRSLAQFGTGQRMTANPDIGAGEADELKRLQGLATPSEKAFAAEQEIFLPDTDIDLSRAKTLLDARRALTGRSGITPEQRDRQLDIAEGRLDVSQKSLAQRTDAQKATEAHRGYVSTKIPGKDRITLDTQRGVLDDVRRMREAFKRTGGDTGPIAGRITRLLQRVGNIGEDDAVLLSETENLLAQFAKTISGGAVAESEFKRLMAQLPQLQQKPKTFGALLDRFERMAKDRTIATLEGLEATKHDTTGYRQIFRKYGVGGSAPKTPSPSAPATNVPQLRLPASDTEAIAEAERLGVPFEIIE